MVWNNECNFLPALEEATKAINNIMILFVLVYSAD